ncbi:rhomboid family intramembrane serine protease [Terrihabitans sp. B22-R8]|uniref:rhomboid family intramembrane serine protease n=1 Tax=Terrihabitans sp. B22-R8 TaxID=3425128 RepID=UPI00403D1863
MVFIPLSDDNPRLLIRYPFVTWGLIAANLLVYLLFQSGFVLETSPGFAMSWGMIPSVVFGKAVLPPELHYMPALAGFVTSLFLHGDLVHLVGNLLFLWVFADNIEDSMGHIRFTAFYLLCGIAGGAAHAFVMPLSNAPLIGASSAVSGVIAAYLLLHPRVKLWILLFGRLPLRVTAVWIILVWFLVQIAGFYFGGDEAVGWWAHLGGFAAGAVLTLIFKRGMVPLFSHPPKTLTAPGPSTRLEDV